MRYEHMERADFDAIVTGELTHTTAREDAAGHQTTAPDVRSNGCE